MTKEVPCSIGRRGVVERLTRSPLQRCRGLKNPAQSLPAHMPSVRAQPLRVIGYAALFNQPDGTGDVIRQGAFTKSLGERVRRGLPILWQHDPNRPLGLWSECREDGRGLLVSGFLTPAVQGAEEAAHLISAGALTGLSIGFRALKAERPRLQRGAIRRVLTQIDLWEISLVTFPQMHHARVRLLPPGPQTDWSGYRSGRFSTRHPQERF